MPAVAQDGTIYFSDSTHIPPVVQPEADFRNSMRACVLALAQARASVRGAVPSTPSSAAAPGPTVLSAGS